MTQQSGDLTKENVEVKEPPQYVVRIFNDHYTTLEFVIDLLKRVFHLTADKAYFVASEAHTKSLAVVGKYTFEIAETKTMYAMQIARENKFPLRLDFVIE